LLFPIAAAEAERFSRLLLTRKIRKVNQFGLMLFHA
jgi:hypothetical protein